MSISISIWLIPCLLFIFLRSNLIVFSPSIFCGGGGGGGGVDITIILKNYEVL